MGIPPEFNIMSSLVMEILGTPWVEKFIFCCVLRINDPALHAALDGPGGLVGILQYCAFVLCHGRQHRRRQQDGQKC